MLQLQSAAQRADKLSQFATYYGDPARVNGELGRYQAVTCEQMHAVARDLCGDDNRVSLSYVPRAAAAEAA